MGIEAFAEAARLLAGDWHVAAVEQVDFRAPVKFYRDEPRTLTVTALLRPDGADLLAECRLSAERALPGTGESQQTRALHRLGAAHRRAPPEPEHDRPPTRCRRTARADPGRRSTGCTSTVRRTR